jgi:hypothetical protein
MSELQIISNNQERQTIYWHQLTAKEKKEFDYLDTEEKQDEATFVRYKHWIYDVSEFMRIEHNEALKRWDGYHSDTYFSGILIKFVPDDSDYVIMGRYYS